MVGRPGYPLSDDLDMDALKRFREIVTVYSNKFELPPSDHELEIAYLIVVMGMRDTDLAVRFGVAVKTIEAQRGMIVIKLGFEHSARQLWRTLARDYWIRVGREHGGE